jgi:hypothetical protein
MIKTFLRLLSIGFNERKKEKNLLKIYLKGMEEIKLCNVWHKLKFMVPGKNLAIYGSTTTSTSCTSTNCTSTSTIKCTEVMGEGEKTQQN